MRAIYLLKTKPTQLDELKTYLGSLRNKDGGYGLKPGAPSSIAATYYVVSISDWLKALEK